MTGWVELDEMLQAVQFKYPATRADIGQIRGELAVMRFILGLEVEEPEKQRQSVRDALDFAPSTSHAVAAIVTQVDTRKYGFTGSFCPHCGGARMVRSGTCEHCADCGETTGCS